jgi:hypothetical protein
MFYTIKDFQHDPDGKWIDFWFQELPVDTDGSYHQCCKKGDLFAALQEAGLGAFYLQAELKGLVTEWQPLDFFSHHLKLVRFITTNQA